MKTQELFRRNRLSVKRKKKKMARGEYFSVLRRKSKDHEIAKAAIISNN